MQPVGEERERSRMSQRLGGDIQRALHLLNSLTEHCPPEKPLGELNPKHIRDCKVKCPTKAKNLRVVGGGRSTGA